MKSIDQSTLASATSTISRKNPDGSWQHGFIILGYDYNDKLLHALIGDEDCQVATREDEEPTIQKGTFVIRTNDLEELPEFMDFQSPYLRLILSLFNDETWEFDLWNENGQVYWRTAEDEIHRLGDY